MSPFDLFTALLAAYALSYLIARERGPWGFLERLRAYGVPDCIYCLSVWMAPLVWLAWYTIPEAVTITALSGGVILLHRYTGGNHV